MDDVPIVHAFANILFTNNKSNSYVRYEAVNVSMTYLFLGSDHFITFRTKFINVHNDNLHFPSR